LAAADDGVGSAGGAELFSVSPELSGPATKAHTSAPISATITVATSAKSQTGRPRSSS
jgi:hypothetical protein